MAAYTLLNVSMSLGEMEASAACSWRSSCFHDAGHENVARRQTKNPRPPPVRLAAFPADEPRPLKLIEEARDGLLGHETFLGQRRWFRSLGTPEHRIKDQELRV